MNKIQIVITSRSTGISRILKEIGMFEEDLRVIPVLSKEESDYLADILHSGIFKGSSLIISIGTDINIDLLREQEILDNHPKIILMVFKESSSPIEFPDYYIIDEKSSIPIPEITIDSVKKLSELRRQVNYYYGLSEERRKVYNKWPWIPKT